MFGYINPDTPYLFKKDEELYKAMYCGLCKGIGEGCGLMARTALTYDAAFMSTLVHNIRGEDVKIKRQRCVLHIFRRRAVALPDSTTVALGCVNTALTYYKLCDDKADGDGKGVLRHLYKKGFRRVLKKHPAVAELVARQMCEQNEIEKNCCSIIDAACEPTAAMMRDISEYVLGEHSTEYTKKLFYCIGKWVYLIDALDDYDKDVKKKRFNVLYNAYGTECRAEAVKQGEEELKFIFDMLFADMRECLKNIKFYFNHDLTDNIILRGIPLKTKAIFYGGCDGHCGKKTAKQKGE